MSYKFRKNADPGEWCSLLLPFCLFSLASYDGGELYTFLFAVCSWLTIVNFFIRHVLKKSLQIENPTHATCFVFSLPISLFVWKFFSYYSCFFHVLTLNYFFTWSYDYVLRTLLEKCPGSFTMGEAQILTQGLMLFFLSTENSLLRKISSNKVGYSFMVVPDHVKCLQVLILGCLALIFLTYSFPPLRRGIKFFTLFILTSFIMMFTWRLYLDEDIFVWLLKFCLLSQKRVFLLLYWISCTVFCTAFVILINLSSVPNGSALIRKVFHFIITAVYVPGILYDLELLRLASGIAFAAFLMLELCRVLKIPPIGSIIENAFQIFLDEKDSGVLILTHIYLLLGCSFPVWICYYSSETKGFHVCLLSGILSVGIGDTVAAMCGKSFGRHKWKGTNKTIEGSIGCFIVQTIVGFIFFNFAGHSFTRRNISLLTIAVFSTTYLEAKTNQVDNLVLPLLMFSILSMIH